MIGELVAATTGLRAVSDMVVGLQNLKTTADVHAKAIELNQKILTVQQELFAAHMKETALVDEVRDLKGQIARMKDWDAEKQRYELAAPFSGCMVYALKKSASRRATARPLITFVLPATRKASHRSYKAEKDAKRRKARAMPPSSATSADPWRRPILIGCQRPNTSRT